MRHASSAVCALEGQDTGVWGPVRELREAGSGQVLRAQKGQVAEEAEPQETKMPPALEEQSESSRYPLRAFWPQWRNKEDKSDCLRRVGHPAGKIPIQIKQQSSLNTRGEEGSSSAGAKSCPVLTWQQQQSSHMWKLKGLMPSSTCQALGKTGSAWGLLCASLPLPVRGQKGRQRLHSSSQVWILKETWKDPWGLPRIGSIKNKRQRGRPLNRNLQIRHHNRTVRQVGKAREGTVYHLWKAHGCWGYE